MNVADRLRIREWTSQVCVITLICISITAPAIALSPALPYFKAEQLLLPVVLCAYLWLLLAGIARPIQFNGMFLVGFLYCVCNAFSMWYGSEILGHKVILRDFYELPKVWLPVAFFTMAYEAKLSESSLRRLIEYFSVAVLLVCAYAWAQFVGLGFTYRLNSYYSSGGHQDVNLEYARRVYATMGNPNILGELMTWCVILFVLAALFDAGQRVRYIMVALACLVTLVMTASRYALLNIAIGLVLTVVVLLTAGRRNAALIPILFALLPVFVWTFQAVASSNPRTQERYQTLRDPLHVDSLRQRLDEGWPEWWGQYKISPIFGHGVSKTFFWGTEGSLIVDSEYLGVLREEGAVGLLVFLAYYLYPLYLIRKGLRAARSTLHLGANRFPATIAAIFATVIFGILALIMNIGMGTFYVPFVQGFLWLWLGIGARAAIDSEQEHSEINMRHRDQWALSRFPGEGIESKPLLSTTPSSTRRF